MSKNISIIGVGTGQNQLTRASVNAINNSELVFGASRMLELCQDLCTDKECVAEYKASIIKHKLEESSVKNIVVLVSGDTGFYSATESIINELEGHNIKVYPGISSVCAMSAKIGIPWQNMKLISCHGRNGNLIDTVRRNRYTFALLGNNANELLLELCKKGFGELSVFIGSDLDMDNEKITKGIIQDMVGADYPVLSVIVIINDKYNKSVPVGIPCDAFARGEVPITKEEVRAVSMSKLRVASDSVCIDVGCGTGSVTVEMALAAYNGKVYAIDKNPEAINLTRENVKRFHIGNVEVIRGEASSILNSERIIEMPTVAFIGGSTGELSEIIDKLLLLNPDIRIVVNAIVIETMSQAVKLLEDKGMEVDITELSVNKSKKVGSGHMMMSQNNIFIITGKK